MASLIFKGKVIEVGSKEQFGAHFVKKDIVLQGIEEYQDNKIVINLEGSDADEYIAKDILISVNYRVKVKPYNGKNYGSNVYESHTDLSVGEEEDSTDFTTGADGKLLDHSKPSDTLIDDLIKELD